MSCWLCKRMYDRYLSWRAAVSGSSGLAYHLHNEDPWSVSFSGNRNTWQFIRWTLQYLERMKECTIKLLEEVRNVYLRICDMSCQQKGAQLDHDLPFPCNGQRRSCLHVDSIKKQQLYLYRSTKGIVKNRGKNLGAWLYGEEYFFLYLPSVRYTFRRLLVPPFVCCSLTCEHLVNTPIASVQKSAYMLVNQEGGK